MNELKSFNSERIYWAVEQVEQETGDINGLHLDDSLFYRKPEADKVIAEKDKEIDKLQDKVADLLLRDRNMALHFNNAVDDLVHNKYKRCMAMTEMCKARYDAEDAKENWCGLSWEYISEEMKYWERWRQRWLELAEKFEGKQ